MSTSCLSTDRWMEVAKDKLGCCNSDAPANKSDNRHGVEWLLRNHWPDAHCDALQNEVRARTYRHALRLRGGGASVHVINKETSTSACKLRNLRERLQPHERRRHECCSPSLRTSRCIPWMRCEPIRFAATSTFHLWKVEWPLDLVWPKMVLIWAIDLPNMFRF